MKDRKILSIVIIFVVIVLVFFIYRSIALTPQKVVKSMLKNTARAKTCHCLANISFDGKIKNAPVSIKATVDVDMDVLSDEEPKILSNLQGVLQAYGIPISAKAEMRNFKDSAYIQLIELPATYDIEKPPIKLDMFKNKWVKISTDEKKFNAKQKSLREEFKKWINEKEIFSKIDKMREEDINGKKCFHYSIIVNKGAIVDLIQRMNKVLTDAGTKDIEKIKKGVVDIEELKVEIWIEKKDHLLYKFKTSFKLPLISNISETSDTAVEMIFSKYNEKVNVEKPLNAINLEETIKENIPQSSFTKMPPEGGPSVNLNLFKDSVSAPSSNSSLPGVNSEPKFPVPHPLTTPP